MLIRQCCLQYTGLSRYVNTDRQKGRQVYRQTGRQADRQTDRQADGQTGRSVDN